MEKQIRREMLEVRLSAEEKKLLQAAAILEGLPLATWARQVLLKAAQVSA